MTGKEININGENKLKISLSYKQWIGVFATIITMVISFIGIYSKLDARMTKIDENRELLDKKLGKEEFYHKKSLDSLNQEIIKHDLQEIKRELRKLNRGR